VDWLALDAGEYRPVRQSELIDADPDGLRAAIDWPAV